MEVRVRIKRFDPDRDERSHWEEYRVETEPTDRVLDVLLKIRDEEDSTLALRKSCAHGVCGSDAMLINGLNRLACKTLIRDVCEPIEIEPLKGLSVIKDLVVDMDPFFDSFRTIKPYLVNDETPPPVEWRQTQEERARFDDTSNCILCGSCTTSCPSFWFNREYLGPAALVAAHRFVFDTRDRAAAERLDVVNAREGVWRCRTIFNCVQACPREINITKAIGQLKKALVYNSF